MNVNLEDLAAIIAGVLASRAQPPRPVLRTLDRLAVCALIVDGTAAVRELNTSADVVTFAALRANARFASALRAATGEPPRGAAMPLVVPAKGLCEVTLSPLAVHLALVLIAPTRGENVPALEQMRREYGLTDAESRVLAALTGGAKVSEIALDYGVKASTVRAQVRSLFEKTGVNRQSDLVRLALTMPRAANEPVAAAPAVALRFSRL